MPAQLGRAVRASIRLMQTKQHRKRPAPPHAIGHTAAPATGCYEEAAGFSSFVTPPPKLRKLQLQLQAPHPSAAVDTLVAACRADGPVPAGLTSWVFHGRRISNVTLHIAQCPNVPTQLHDLQEQLRSHSGTALVVLKHGAGTYHEWIMRT